MRIEKLGEYIEQVLQKMNEDYIKINADFLDINIKNYSLDKIPTSSVIEEDIVGNKKCRDVFNLRSKRKYSSNQQQNMKNIGFFEEFQSIINSNNDEGILPEIKNIESIKCLNTGTFNSADASNKTAVFDIQIEIEYEEEVSI